MKPFPVSFQSKLFKFLLSSYLRRLTGRLWLADQSELGFSKKGLDLILKQSWDKYSKSVLESDKQANLGNWMVMNFAHLTLGAFQVLIEQGLSEQDAINLIYKLTWEITSTWTKRAKRFSGVIFREPKRELAYFVDLVMKTFFPPPAYRFVTGEINNGFFLDVKRCPVAELMATNGISDLCIQTWCGVDFGLVKIIGGSLQREGTLAMGRDKCDFVFLHESR